MKARYGMQCVDYLNCNVFHSVIICFVSKNWQGKPRRGWGSVQSRPTGQVNSKEFQTIRLIFRLPHMAVEVKWNVTLDYNQSYTKQEAQLKCPSISEELLGIFHRIFPQLTNSLTPVTVSSSLCLCSALWCFGKRQSPISIWWSPNASCQHVDPWAFIIK